MAGLGSGGFGNEAATPARSTRIRFDVAEKVLTEQPYAQQRASDDMALTKLAMLTRVVNMAKLGWELDTYTKTYTVDESTQGQGQILLPSNGKLKTTDDHKEVPMYRPPTELSGATDGSTNLVAGSASKGIQKKQKANASWNKALPGSGIEPPTSENAPTIAVDRVATTTNNHDPNAPLLVRFYVPGNGYGTPDLLARIVFNGPPSGNRKTFHGKGLYCLNLHGDGQAYMFEYGTSTVDNKDVWDTEPVQRLRWAQPNQIGNRTHALYIRPYAIKPLDQPSGLLYIGGGIQFTLGASAQTTPASALTLWRNRPQQSDTSLLRIPAHAPAAVLRKPAEIHFRRDIRPVIQVSVTKYYATGTLRDDPFSCEFHPTNQRNFILQWWGSMADGTSITAKMYAADGTALPVAEDHHAQGWMSFTPKWGQKSFYVEFTLNASGDQKYSPVLSGYLVTRDGVVSDVAPGEFGGGILESLSITGPSEDPTHETASVQIADPYNILAPLRIRGEIPFIIDTTYDPSDPSKRSILHRGYTNRIDAKRKGTNGRRGMGAGPSGANDYPSPMWRNYDLKSVGVWKRLSESLCARRFNWARDFRTGEPFKVTDAIRTMLTWAGWPEAWLDIPDLDMPLFPPNGGDGTDLLVEPGADLGEFILRLANDYLGWHLIFDPNAAPGKNADDEFGMWRLLPPATPPYTYLANFIQGGPQAAGKIVHNINSYGPTTLTNGQSVPTTYIRKGTLNSHINPPEANLITVSGVGQIEGTDELALLTQTVYNPVSFDFGPKKTADSTHPDYLGRCVPVEFFDPCLTSAEMVNFVIYRLATRIFHAQKIISFEAPLILVTDKKDKYQCRPRPLRFYDPIMLEGTTTAIIRSVNPTYHKDGVQMAVYECEIPPPELQ